METRDMVRMANQIADFFAPYPRGEAVDGIAKHVHLFWDPRMRNQLRPTWMRAARASRRYSWREPTTISPVPNRRPPRPRQRLEPAGVCSRPEPMLR